VIIEKFHRLEDDMLVALSLTLVKVSMVGLMLGAILFSLFQSRGSSSDSIRVRGHR
jgi:hypothetical protein